MTNIFHAQKNHGQVVGTCPFLYSIIITAMGLRQI